MLWSQYKLATMRHSEFLRKQITRILNIINRNSNFLTLQTLEFQKKYSDQNLWNQKQNWNSTYNGGPRNWNQKLEFPTKPTIVWPCPALWSKQFEPWRTLLCLINPRSSPSDALWSLFIWRSIHLWPTQISAQQYYACICLSWSVRMQSYPGGQAQFDAYSQIEPRQLVTQALLELDKLCKLDNSFMAQCKRGPIADTPMAGDTSILKLVQDGVLPDCHSPRVSLCRANLSLIILTSRPKLNTRGKTPFFMASTTSSFCKAPSILPTGMVCVQYHLWRTIFWSGKIYCIEY